MGVFLSVRLSETTCHLVHDASQAQIRTTPPRDNGGDGTSFSPTDLMAAALASCALTTLALIAAREGLTWGDASATLEKDMVGSPRRIGRLTVVFTMPRHTRVEQRPRLEEIAKTCPVALSLHPDVEVPMTFVYPD